MALQITIRTTEVFIVVEGRQASMTYLEPLGSSRLLLESGHSSACPKS